MQLLIPYLPTPLGLEVRSNIGSQGVAKPSIIYIISAIYISFSS
jgi:hypothetical protein